MKKEQCEKANQFGKCPFVTSQQLIKGKWAILILHELYEGPVRFKELQRHIDITQATLSAQLKYLEQEGLIKRQVYPEIPPRVEYSLTDIGYSFTPVLNEIEKWGMKYIYYLEEKNKEKSVSANS